MPLGSLFDRHPEARRANPREIGLRTISTDEIVGTAVGGASQRGADFLPLKPFRSANWAGRWRRIRQGNEMLAVLPPIDVVRYGEGYWVVDGHNRVAAALYDGQVEVDANVVELVPPGAAPSERSSSLESVLLGRTGLRGVARTAPPAAVAADLDVRTTPAGGDEPGAPGRRPEPDGPIEPAGPDDERP